MSAVPMAHAWMMPGRDHALVGVREETAMSTTRRNLVLARVGDRSLHRHWLIDGGERSWDLQLNAYGNGAAQLEDQDLPTVIDHGTKLDSIARHLRAHPQLLEQYDYVLLPDDDLLMSAGDIDRVFAIMREHDLTVAQPSLTIDSFIDYAIFLHCPQFKLRYTNYLEGMACCFKASYLRELLPLFERYVSGWGISHVWTLLMPDPAYRAAIIDEVPMTHTRKHHSGPLYRQFAARGVDPYAEMRQLMASYSNTPTQMVIYGGVLADGRRTGAMAAQLRNALHLLRVARRSGIQRKALRKGLRLLAQVVSHARYRPARLRPVAE